MNEKLYRTIVQMQLQCLRAAEARKWVQNATPALVDDFKACKGWAFSPEMCKAIMSEIERVSTHAA